MKTAGGSTFPVGLMLTRVEVGRVQLNDRPLQCALCSWMFRNARCVYPRSGVVGVCVAGWDKACHAAATAPGAQRDIIACVRGYDNGWVEGLSVCHCLCTQDRAICAQSSHLYRACPINIVDVHIEQRGGLKSPDSRMATSAGTC